MTNKFLIVWDSHGALWMLFMRLCKHGSSIYKDVVNMYQKCTLKVVVNKSAMLTVCVRWVNSSLYKSLFAVFIHVPDICIRHACFLSDCFRYLFNRRRLLNKLNKCMAGKRNLTYLMPFRGFSNCFYCLCRFIFLQTRKLYELNMCNILYTLGIFSPRGLP